MPTPDHFVLDASVTMSWCLDDEAEGYADDVLNHLLGGEALVPCVWPLEVANVLVVAEKKGRLTSADSNRFVCLLDDLPIRVIQETPARVMGEVRALARTENLSSYDASYLDLAMREGMPIATKHSRLRDAAQRCHVPVVGVG